MRPCVLVLALLLAGCGTAMHKSPYADKCVPEWALVAASDNGRFVAVRSSDPTGDPGDVWVDRESCAEVKAAQ